VRTLTKLVSLWRNDSWVTLSWSETNLTLSFSDFMSDVKDCTVYLHSTCCVVAMTSHDTISINDTTRQTGTETATLRGRIYFYGDFAQIKHSYVHENLYTICTLNVLTIRPCICYDIWQFSQIRFLLFLKKMIILKFVETVGLYFCVCDSSLDALSKVQQMPSTSLAFAIGYDVCTSVLASVRLSWRLYVCLA